ncbi:MAG: hypothetical protein JNK16_09475 [Phycisphaerales bacterium]|nr:hypothetical protein [Phycisphaerales bacterium]
MWTQKRDGSRIRGYVVEEEIRTGPYDWVNYPTFVTLVPNGTWRANAWVMAGREAEVDPIRGVLVGSEDAELTIFSGKRPLVTLPWNPDAAEMSLALRRLNDPNFQMGPPAVTPPVLLQRE